MNAPTANPSATTFTPTLSGLTIDTLPASDRSSSVFYAPAGCSPACTAPLAEEVTATDAKPRAEQYNALNFPLLTLAESLNDIEQLRIATGNRLRQLAEVADARELASLQAMVDGFAVIEKQAIRDLERAAKCHPLGAWIMATKGIGLKQGARLLAAIGNPYWNAAADRPRRGPAELWAYCGYHVLHPGDDRPDCDTPCCHVVAGVAPRLKKGQRANWNSAARMRAFLVAESCMKKPDSPYRPIYDTGRTKYAAVPDLTLIVQHRRALRLVAKAVLRDLYLEAKRWHEASTPNHR